MIAPWLAGYWSCNVYSSVEEFWRFTSSIPSMFAIWPCSLR